jgi:hypothetical protein
VGAGGVALVRTRTRKKAARRGGPSKNELAYAEHLEALKQAGEVRFYTAQPERIELAHRCTYQPDFEVAFTDEDRPWEFVEVKGARSNGRPFYFDDGAKVKVKFAARTVARGYVGHIVVVVWPKKGGGWNREVVPA